MDVAEAERVLGVRLPSGLRSIYERTDGIFRDQGQWWVVWPLDRLVAGNRAHWNSHSLPSILLAFGDDGTGNPFCVPVNGSDDVVRWSWIDGDIEERTGTLADFAAAWLSP